ncbi:MAG: hypothetical protein ACFE7R_11750 [Candidatus Hodarchaeota archaeon]
MTRQSLLSCHTTLLLLCIIQERNLARTLGIATGYHLAYIRYYIKSRRVSAHWQAHTSSQKDVKRWWEITPPNDKRKNARLENYFKGNGKEFQDETP